MERGFRRNSLQRPLGSITTIAKESCMSRHHEMPPVPPANRSHKGTGDDTQVNKDAPKNKGEVNTAEQGDTANVKQNTTNAGFFKGRRVK
jgi:hypothetical protein